MAIFFSTLNQMGFLALLIVIGYLLSRFGVVGEDAPRLLSKLENFVFIPALILSTFMENFTLEKIRTAGSFLLCGLVVVLLSIPVALLGARLTSKDDYIRKIYTYGLAFSNFGFMGNAVVLALFPEVFLEYLIFVLPLWFFIYLWGVPALLIPSTGEKKGVLARLRPLLNPMFIAMLIGAVLGLLDLPLPSFVTSAASSLGNCMSPVAMLLTGMTIAGIRLGPVFRNVSIYVVSLIRLLVIPLVAILLLKWIPISHSLSLCTVVSLGMPLGLNTIVVPNAYGLDTSVAAGMALISHMLSCLTIPLVFMIFHLVVGTM